MTDDLILGVDVLLPGNWKGPSSIIKKAVQLALRRISKVFVKNGEVEPQVI